MDAFIKNFGKWMAIAATAFAVSHLAPSNSVPTIENVHTHAPVSTFVGDTYHTQGNNIVDQDGNIVGDINNY